ncbi:MAG: Ig-like domain-containing protein [Clostridia bacterium]|nr:Ig-like domain-containing protein [Clostridia bacterium]
MRSLKCVALVLALCLLASIMTAGLMEASELEPDIALAQSVDEDTGLSVETGEAVESPADEASETPEETGDGEDEAGYAVAAAPLPDYSYWQVGTDGAAVYVSGEDWEVAALLSAGDVVLVTGSVASRAPIAFYADGSVLVGYMDAADLLPMNEEKSLAYLNAVAASSAVGLYKDDLNWPLLPLANVTYEDDRAVLASANYTDYSNDKVYTLNGKQIYANMVPDTGVGNCWKWAQGIYKLVWGCQFSETFAGNASTGLNLLGNLNDAQRTLTPAHLKAFIQQTAPGATIRVQSCTSECARFNNDGLSCGHKGHSLIVVDKNADGVFTMDSHSGSQHTRFYSWQGFCNAWKGYAYVKYIKWPGAKPLAANSISADGSAIAVTGVSLNQTAITIYAGESATLTATVAPSNATNSIVSWASSDASVAAVADGVVTGVKAGTATIAVKTADGGKTATCAVTVKRPILQKALTKTGGNGTVVLGLGEQLQLSPDFATARGWTIKGVKSSKSKVAPISESGLVTALAQGKTKITVTTKNRKKATLTVQVVDPTVPTKIVLNKSGTVKLKVGDTLKLETAILPTTATSPLTWKSSKPKVAAVDANGNVVALKKGSCKIAVRTANGKIAKVKIKVSK